MTEPLLLADHIDEQAEAILAVWRATVEREGDVPAAERLSHREFLDHVPVLLERLAERLRGRPGDVVAEAKEHGAHRWRQGYDIGAIINEFAHLRTALCRSTLEYARDQGWGLTRLEAAYEAINEVLSEATAESVRQFEEDGRREHQKALAEAERRSQSAEQAWALARAEQARLRAVLQSLPAAVWVVDAGGTIVVANDVADRLHRPLDPDYIGRANIHDLGPAYRVFRPDGSAYASDALPLARGLRGETVTQEELVWEIDGSHRTLLINAAPLNDTDGRPAGAVGVAQDVTVWKRHEDALRRQLDLFRAISEALGEGLCTLDLEGRVDFLNPAAEQLLGWARDELIGRRLDETVRQERRDGTPYPADETPFRQVRRTATTIQGDQILIRKDGSRLSVSFIASPILTDGRMTGLVLVLRDNSERIAQEDALNRQRERAEEASRHKTRLVSALSHDVRTPLNAVVLAAQLLEIHFNSDTDAEIQQCLRTIRHSVRNILDLLGDLLNLSRLDSGVVAPEVSRFPLEPVLAECLASVETQAKLKGLDIRLDAGDLAGFSLETDRAKLKQIIANFLSNAVRYTERGRVRLVGSHPGGQVRIAVADSGVGIHPGDQGRIFDEFAVLEHPRRKLGEGTGLGLAICRRLAILLGGEILLESVPGEGSTFTLVLPDATLARARQRPEASNGDLAPAAVRPEVGVILVAEDHPDSRQTLAKVLRRMGYRVLEASNGRDVLSLVEDVRPLAVLMDVNMPLMNGVDATVALRADPRFHDLPIFALTGDVTPDNQLRIGEAGVNGYLEKPVSWDLLEQALASIDHRPEA
jgi:PAS domain S-box-containing protein